MGIGLIDELLKEQYDPETGESLGCWNTINTENTPEDKINADPCLFDLKAQGIQSKIVSDLSSPFTYTNPTRVLTVLPLP